MSNEQSDQILDSLRKSIACIHIATRRRVEKRDYYEMFLMYLSGLTVDEISDIKHTPKENVLDKVRFLIRRWDAVSKSIIETALVRSFVNDLRACPEGEGRAAHTLNRGTK